LTKDNKKILKAHKTLKRLIRKHSLLDTLHIIWSFSKRYTFDNNLDQIEFGQKTIHEHELEFLLKEAVLYCESKPNNPWTPKDQFEYTKQLRIFDNVVSGVFLENNDIFVEFNRITHRQFKWQRGYSQRALMRYLKVFSDPLVDEVVFEKFNLTTRDINLVGIYFFGMKRNQFRTVLPLPLPSNSKTITPKMVEHFLDHFAIDYEEAKDILTEKRELNENIFYTQNPLYDKPLIKYESTVMCPLHLPLFRMITSGIYYSIVGEDKFKKDNRFGASFEKYIGEVLTKLIRKKRFEIIPEFEYYVGKQRKDSSDWILKDKTGLMFIECKTKRMLFTSISSLDTAEGLEKDLKKLAEFVCQPYKVYHDYRTNKIDRLNEIEPKIFIPVTLTLEDWFIKQNPGLYNRLSELVTLEFQRLKLPEEYLTKHPYLLFSASEFEIEAQLINRLGFHTYLKKMEEQKLSDFREKFKYKEIFKDEYDDFFLGYLEKLKAEQEEE
jgi:hypothetical protein